MNQCDFYLAVFGLDLYLPLDPNTIYYTLSTIAQTLAGALAVLVAIVLFNFSRANDAIQNGVSLDPTQTTPPSTKWLLSSNERVEIDTSERCPAPVGHQRLRV